MYSGLNLNQDKATKPQTVQIVRQGEATPYWFIVNPLYFFRRPFHLLRESYLNIRSD
ncbi:transposase [Neisseria macacae ATCC 33926]|uniref:Transposase n=1 Tax=Neisseria macacae ATCC 33926 TaxID=997348 RepID=A0AA36XJP2_9NEIS|nr:transposase [Neisseria macacae ATCC 33926]